MRTILEANLYGTPVLAFDTWRSTRGWANSPGANKSGRRPRHRSSPGHDACPWAQPFDEDDEK